MNQAVSGEVLAPAETALTVVQRASVALGAAEHEKRLMELAKRSTGIVAITNPDGYKECHAARMALKRERVNLETLGKAARDDATKFSKAVIAEEKRLIALIEPEEERLQRIQTAHDEAVEKAERERVTSITARIDLIKLEPQRMVGKGSAAISEAVQALRARVVEQDEFQEFTEAATLAREASLLALEGMERQALEAEREVERVRQERAELEQARLKLEAEQREHREKMERDEREARERREADETRLREQQAAIDAQRREQEDRDRAVAQAEADRILKERQEQADREQRERAEAEAAAREQRQIAQARMDDNEWLRDFSARRTGQKEYARIVKAIDAYFAKVKA